MAALIRVSVFCYMSEKSGALQTAGASSSSVIVNGEYNLFLVLTVYPLARTLNQGSYTRYTCNLPTTSTTFPHLKEDNFASPAPLTNVAASKLKL